MKGMKRFSCASPASAAVCTSIDRRSMVRSTIVGRSSVDHHLSNLKDPRKARSLSKAKSYSEKSRKSLDLIRSSTSTSSSGGDATSPGNSARYLLDDTASFFDVYPELGRPPPLNLTDKPQLSAPTERRRRSSTVSFMSAGNTPRILRPMKENESSSRISARPFSVSTSITPCHSQVWARSLVPVDTPRLVQAPKSDELVSAAVLSPTNSTEKQQDQVVVLRVSLHCKGCEGKVRKHISKMQGVTSFTIDFATKKVTVKGDVTPLGVLNSVLKVKNAQFWPSPPPASAAS